MLKRLKGMVEGFKTKTELLKKIKEQEKQNQVAEVNEKITDMLELVKEEFYIQERIGRDDIQVVITDDGELPLVAQTDIDVELDREGTILAKSAKFSPAHKVTFYTKKMAEQLLGGMSYSLASTDEAVEAYVRFIVHHEIRHIIQSQDKELEKLLEEQTLMSQNLVTCGYGNMPAEKDANQFALNEATNGTKFDVHVAKVFTHLQEAVDNFDGKYSHSNILLLLNVFKFEVIHGVKLAVDKVKGLSPKKTEKEGVSENNA